MSNPIRVLQVFTIMDMGGAETMIMNYYRNIDRSKVQFDFLVHRPEKGYYEDEIKSLGGRIYRVAPLYDTIEHIKAIRHFLAEHVEYEIIHSHVSLLGYFLYKEAKRKNVPFLIAHAHSSGCDFSWRWPLWTLLRFLIRPHITHTMTCGSYAAVWTFGNKLAQNSIMMKNAIEAEKFSFSQITRQKIRKAMSWSESYVIANVARFVPSKNHKYLLSIFNEVLSTQPNAVLALIGAKSGEYDEVRQTVEELGITDKVHFLGARNDVHNILQAADVICMPSLYEGFSVSMVEAQAAGLRVITSNCVPKEAEIIKDSINFIDLSAPISIWAEALVKPYQRKNTYAEICAAGFDIRANAKWLQDFYLEKGRTL